MDLNTAEKYLLLILHPDKSRYLVTDQVINPGLLGAILVDLSIDGKIEIRDRKVFSKSSYCKLSEAHNLILNKISRSKRPRRVKTWISNLNWFGRKYRHMLLHDLAMKSKIRMEDKWFLFIKYKKAHLLDRDGRRSLLAQLKDVIINNKEMNDNTAPLLGIIQACNMQKVLSKDNNELKVIKSTLKDLTRKDTISTEIVQVIEELNVAAITTVVVNN